MNNEDESNKNLQSVEEAENSLNSTDTDQDPSKASIAEGSTSIETRITQVPQPLASRWSRLFASILDAIIMMIILMPMMYFMDVFSMMDENGQLPLDMTIITAVLGIVVFLMINGHYLLTRGQTVGKMALSIKIVDQNGDMPTKDQLFKRYFLYFGISHLPYIGGFLSFANIVLIFGQTKQCGHDQFAKTFVISDEVSDGDIQSIIDKRNSQG